MSTYSNPEAVREKIEATPLTTETSIERLSERPPVESQGFYTQLQLPDIIDNHIDVAHMQMVCVSQIVAEQLRSEANYGLDTILATIVDILNHCSSEYSLLLSNKKENATKLHDLIEEMVYFAVDMEYVYQESMELKDAQPTIH